MTKITIILILSLYGCAAHPFAEWDRGDTARQIAVTGLIAADWYQTTRITDSPDFYEKNPILGENPSHSSINLYFPVMMAAHTCISGFLEPKWRKAWQYIWIGTEAYTVFNNHRMGVR